MKAEVTIILVRVMPSVFFGVIHALSVFLYDSCPLCFLVRFMPSVFFGTIHALSVFLYDSCPLCVFV